MLLLTLLIFFMPNSSCSAVQSRQRRAWIIDSYDIEEEHPGPFPYVLGKVSIDRKYQIFFDLYGKGVDEDPKGVFTINKQTGEIFVQKPLDREKEEMLELSFEAKKSHDLSIDTRLGIEILIRDINDNPPVFERPLYEVTVDEGLPQGSHLHTVVAYDRDKENTRNSTFHYAIKSVSPESSNIKFIIGEKGALSFYGCLDHEVTSKYTLLVEAIDHGEVVQLSSSTTVVIYVEDGNDNLPVIIGQTGSGKVKENESGVSPLRFHVMDKDMSQSKAWRAKYTIYEDKEKNFKIETHTETNDGILTVVKPLDFEDGTTRKLKISVENEAPYFSCIVKKKLSIGLWDVEFTKEQSSGGNIRYNTTITIIEIEDVNDPPNFIVTVKEANLKEDAKMGTWVEKVTAVDRDRTASSDFIYKVGHDPAGWMKIDPHTGDITTIKMVDRESIHVVNNTYTLILHAVDHGQPPMTGTATLKIYLIDVNDNVPQLDMVLADICLSDGQTPTNISATDPDGTPFGGPFTFELLGDVKGKWKLDPSYGFTAGLVRDASVYAGFYTLSVKVSDLQGQSGIYRLNTTVCSCSVARNCRNRNTGTTTGSGAVGIALALVLLLLLVLLAAIYWSCKEEFHPVKSEIPNDYFYGFIDSSNTETLGTDCKVPNSITGSRPVYLTKDPRCLNTIDRITFENYWRTFFQKYRETITASNTQDYRYLMIEESLFMWIQWKLSSFRETVADLPDYEPHIYAEEGNLDTTSLLDCLEIPDDHASFDSVLEDLGPAFSQLASICMPLQCQVTSTETKMIFTQYTV